jgi:hypothetical protein
MRQGPAGGEESTLLERQFSVQQFRFFIKNKIALMILQYNVRNEKMRMMIFLLIDDNIQNFDVIVIQKL